VLAVRYSGREAVLESEQGVQSALIAQLPEEFYA